MSTLSGKRPLKVLVLIAGLAMLASAAGGDVAKLESIVYQDTPSSAVYRIEPTGSPEFREYTMDNPRRLVVDLLGVENVMAVNAVKGDGTYVTNVRTSQFRVEPDLVTRVVFDLGPQTKYKVARAGKSIEVRFFTSEVITPPQVMGASMAPEAGVPEATAPEKSVANKEVAAQETPAQETPAQDAPAKEETSEWKVEPEAQWPDPAAADAASSVAATRSSEGETIAPQRLSFPGPAVGANISGGSLSNKPLTVDVQGADIKTVLRSIAEFSGANIVAGPKVEGPVTVHLSEVPWKEALSIVLRSNGYGYKEEYGIIRVGIMDDLHEEEIKAVSVARKKEEMQPLVAEVVELNFVNAEEMKTAMSKITSKRGSVEVERGTNAVIINDIPSNVSRISEMVIALDQKIDQVEIIAKMVDVDFEATRELGVNWEALNIMGAGGQAAAGAITRKDLADPFGIFRVGTVQSWGDLALTIEALEKENKANIISNPRVTTADNKEAKIMVGKEIPLIVSDEAGNPITELKKVGVILRVKPHVNSDATITMDLHPEISELSSQATVQGGVIISVQEADTRVVVRDGETAVIGGLINEVESKSESGLPVLKDVPIVGGLFKYSSKTTKKRELIIFVTPRIVH